MSIPSTVTNVGRMEFGHAWQVRGISVHPDNPNYISDEDGILFNKDKTILRAYPPGRTNNSYNIPNTVAILDYSSFKNSQNLTIVNIPQSVHTVGEMAFYHSGICSVEIPSTITNIGERAFTYVSNLTNISVHPDNPYFNSKDGVLLSKDKTILIAYPNKTNSSYTIPSTVTSIGKYAAYHLTYLTSVDIPDSVTNIEINAFASSVNLADVTFGNSVKNIGPYVFAGTSLTNVIIGKSVTNIGLNAFMACNKLKEITLLGDGPFTSGFLNYVSATIYYLPNSTGWSSYNWALANQVGVLNTSLLLPKINSFEASEIRNPLKKTLRFKGYSGVNYAVQKSDDLKNWITKTNHTGDGNEITYSEDSTNTQGFYRVFQQ